MQAILKTKRGPGIEILDMPRPAPRTDEVLVHVNKTGICGTDKHIFEWDQWAAGRIQPPVIIGHEFVGIVESVGASVRTVRPGERVSGEGHIVCGHCRQCRTGNAHICTDVRVIGVDTNGCFAPYVVVPESNIWRVHPAISDDQAALFDPFGNAMHTVAAQPVAGRTVLVIGCGAIGLMAIGIARANGADIIIAAEPNGNKRKLATLMGADTVLECVNERAVKEAAGSEGVDVMLEMSGAPKAIVEGLRCMRNGGDAALLGIPNSEVSVPWAEQVIFKAITLRGINGRRMFETWYQCESLLRRQPKLLEPLITHRLPFDKFEQGVRAMQDGTACKVVLDWTNART